MADGAFEHRLDLKHTDDKAVQPRACNQRLDRHETVAPLRQRDGVRHAQGALETGRLQRRQAVELGAQVRAQCALVARLRHYPAHDAVAIDPFDGAEKPRRFLQRGGIGFPFGARGPATKRPAALHLPERIDARLNGRAYPQYQFCLFIFADALQSGAFSVEQTEPHCAGHGDHGAGNARPGARSGAAKGVPSSAAHSATARGRPGPQTRGRWADPFASC